MAGPNRQKGAKRAEERSLRWWATRVGGAAVGVALVAALIVSARSSSTGAAKGTPTAAPYSPPHWVCDNASPPLLDMKVARTTPYPMTINRNANYEAEISTSCGTMLIKLYPQQAPIAVNNFVHLARAGFYVGIIFHRIDKTLGIIQAGDPGCPISISMCGKGGPGYTIRDEFPNGLKPHVGTVAMASAGTPNSSGSQFEIVAAKSLYTLPKERTIFGELVGRHSFQVAKLILSVPTKRAPGAPVGAPADFSSGEFVYIKDIKIIVKH